jgi:hypothetical protein
MDRDSSAGVDRRSFLGLTAGAVAAGIAGALPLVSPARAEAADASVAAAPAQQALPAASPAAKHLAAAMQERFKSAIDPARIGEIEQGIDGSLQMLGDLAKVPLSNADEPAFVFSAMHP